MPWWLAKRRTSLDEFAQHISELLASECLEGGSGLYFRTAGIAASLTAARHAVVVLPHWADRARGPAPELRVAGCFGEKIAGLLPSKEGIIGRVYWEKRHALVRDVTSAGDYREWDPAVRSELAVPILDQDQKDVEAVINVESERRGHFRRTQVSLIRNLGRLMLLCRDRLQDAHNAKGILDLLWNLPDEVMVIDRNFRPIWANLAKRRTVELQRLDEFLPEKEKSESDLLELLAGHLRDAPKREDEKCFCIIEGRKERCPFCVSHRAMTLREVVEAVLYKPEQLNMLVELSAAPILKGDSERAAQLLGCVEVARRVTRRQQVLKIAPELWKESSETKALERLVAILHRELRYSRIRLYDVEEHSQNIRLLGITLQGSHGLDKEAFRQIERIIPKELEDVVLKAQHAALLIADDQAQEVKKEQSFGYWQARVPRNLLITAFDRDGHLALDQVNEIAAVPFVVGGKRRLLCLDWLDPTNGGSQRRRFSSDDLQALTICSRLAAAALESVRQADSVARLTLLGEVAATLTHLVAHTLRSHSSTEFPSHLDHLLHSLAQWSSSWDFLAEAISSRLRSHAPVPVHGEVQELVAALRTALTAADAPSIREQLVWELARLAVGSPRSPQQWAMAIAKLDSAEHGILEDLIIIVWMWKTQEGYSKELGRFYEVVQEVFPTGAWESEKDRVIDAVEIVEPVLSVFAKRATELNVQVEWEPWTEDTPQESLHLKVKPGQIRLGLLALLDNAIYAAYHGRQENEEPWVGVEASGADNVVRIAVANNGSTMTESDRSKVGVERFTRKIAGGTGIGLVLASGLVQANGGEFQPEYDDKRGLTRFVLVFPRALAGASGSGGP